MARRKDTITQRDFSLGAVRPEAVERDDTVLVEKSCKTALNTVTNTAGNLEERPGSIFVGTSLGLDDVGFGVDLGAGRVYDVHIIPDGVVIYGEDGSTEASFTSAAWASVTGKWGSPLFSEFEFWVVPDPDSSSIIIGSKHVPLHALVVDSAGSWSFGALNYAEKPNGAILQPYWRYYSGVTILPSARTGSITVTASSGIWTDAHDGMRIRYGSSEILLGTRVSSTVMNATVVEELAPTYDLTVASASGYKIGDAVEHSTLGGQGIITDISGSVITVLATAFWDGFSNSGNLTAPNANQALSVLSAVSPAASSLWDIQMLSPVHGYAGHGAKHMGRMYLCGFPGAAQAFAVSSAGFVDDFTMGVNDGDGFVETLGANDGGTLRYVLSAEDLLFFTSKGLYYQQTRDGSAVTPLSIGPVRFSRKGCAEVIPVAVDDGAIFVDAVGQQIYGAMLTGVQYRSWSAVHLSKYHNHLFGTMGSNSASKIGAASDGAEAPEEFIYIVMSGGDAVVGRLNREDNSVGWHPWETEGSYKKIYQAFGEMRQIVQRTGVGLCYEKISALPYLDCAGLSFIHPIIPDGPWAPHLDALTASVYFDGWDLGDRLIDSNGKPLDDDGGLLDIPDHEAWLYIGFAFSISITPWARRSVNSYRGKRDVKRTVGMLLTVQDTGQFEFEGQAVGGYRAGEDMTIPPALRSQEYSFITIGRDDFEDRAITKSRPGPFRLLKIRYKVTI